MVKWKTWDDAFDHHKARGCDPSDAAWRADQWQAGKTRLFGAVRHKWDWRLPKTTADVVALLQRRIEIHRRWRDWLADNPGEADASAGTAQSNQRYIDQYEAAIKVVEGLVLDAPT